MQDNDITHNNLDLIRSLKEEVAEMKKKEISNEKLMFEIAQVHVLHGSLRARSANVSTDAGEQETVGAFDACPERSGEIAPRASQLPER